MTGLLRLGLDWDGTVTAFPVELALLAKSARSVVIVTLNMEVTPAVAARVLEVPEAVVEVRICPDDARHYYDLWKAEACMEANVDLMFDDDERVIEACWTKGVRAILVGKAPPRPPEY